MKKQVVYLDHDNLKTLYKEGRLITKDGLFELKVISVNSNN